MPCRQSRFSTGTKTKFTVAVIVSGLPTLGGWEAIQKMREIRPSLKTLIASAFVPPNLEIEIAQAALDGVIASPIS